MSDEDKRRLLQAGMPLHFEAPAKGVEEPAESKAARTIRGEWLAELASPPERTIHVPIDIRGAIIEGSLDLHYATFEQEASFIDCTFTEKPDFSYTRFRRNAIFRGATFSRGVSFESCSAEYDFFLPDANFVAGEAVFQGFHVQGSLNSGRANFGPGVKANFNRARIGASAFFGGAVFQGDSDFVSAHVGSQASFIAAQFEGEAAITYKTNHSR